MEVDDSSATMNEQVKAEALSEQDYENLIDK